MGRGVWVRGVVTLLILSGLQVVVLALSCPLYDLHRAVTHSYHSHHSHHHGPRPDQDPSASCVFKNIGDVSIIAMPGVDICLDLPVVAPLRSLVQEEESLLIPLRSFAAKMSLDHPWRPPASSITFAATI